MNRFDVGQGALITRLKETAGRTLTYVRGATSVTLTGWVGNTKFALQPKGTSAATVQWGDRDYLVSVVDLQTALTAGGLSGNALFPIKGDRITDKDSTGATIIYELQTPTGEPVWRYSDQTRQVFRLHCKRVQ